MTITLNGVSAVSDADGNYEIGVSSSGNYELSASKERYVFDTQSIQVEPTR